MMTQTDVSGYRELLFLYYLGMFGASVGWTVNPSLPLSLSLTQVGYTIWVLFLGVGGAAGMVAVAGRHHAVELVALTSLAGALMTHAIALVFATRLLQPNGVNWGLACLSIALALSCVIRGVVVWHQLSVRERVRKEIDDAGPG